MNFPLAVLGLGLFELMIITGIFASLVFWLWMLVDCLTKETSSNDKLVWLLVILFVGIIGAPLYFFMRKLRRPASDPGLSAGNF